MNKSIERSLVNNGLKEDTSYLNAKDLILELSGQSQNL
jgi:hypothetical protein